MFLPNDSIVEYKEYIVHEELMRSKLKESTLEEFEQLLILDSSLNPTRNNILSIDIVRNKLKGWRQMNALQHIEENTLFVKDFLKKHAFQDFDPQYGTADRNHRYIKIDIKKAIEFLKDFKVANVPDSLRKSSTIQYLRYLMDKKGITYAYIFEMSYGVMQGRQRELLTEKGKFKINNIFSGPSKSKLGKYPGDQGISFDDSICIQIHKIQLKHSSMQWDKKVVYTLGMYYPEGFAHSFVGITK